MQKNYEITNKYNNYYSNKGHFVLIILKVIILNFAWNCFIE